jgi:NAD(P)-dependent dehydrogenase (short-subunit alcohol dehydrogenase family)
MTHLSELFDLHHRVAVVTGGAGLLGAEFCKTLAEAGAQVVIADMNETAASQLADTLNKQGLTALGVGTDVRSPDSVQQLVASTLEAYGGLDILVNSAALDPKFDPQHQEQGVQGSEESDSAGQYPSSPNSLTFENYPLDLWKQALEVNLTGMFLCCQAAAKSMLAQGDATGSLRPAARQGGVIINICSMYGLVGPDQRLYQREDQPPQYKPAYYSVTKAGVLGLTRYLATYYAGKNIRVNALTPGGVYNGHDEEFLRAYSARSVLGRMARKDEMNGALLFLASDASSYMTGANLVVDGGWTAW